MIWTIFIKILKNTIQIKNRKYYTYLITWLLICLVIKLSLFLLHNIILLFQKSIRLNSTHYLAMKITNKRNLKKLHLIIHQILTLKTLWIFIKSLLKKYILFRLLILLLHQIILHVLGRIIYDLIMTIDDEIKSETLQLILT